MTAPVLFSRRSLLLLPFALAACGRSARVLEFQGLTMGTSFNIVAIDHWRNLQESEVQAAISTALTQVTDLMSNWDEGSEISRFNAQKSMDRVDISPELAKVMQAAAEVHRISEGRFDTTLGPLIELWGFGAPGRQGVPDDLAIAAALARSGHANTLRISKDALQKRRADAQVYLAAIAKGYGADHVGRALESLGVTDYLVEIGGDLYASGKNPDGLPWQIGIESPSLTNSAVHDVVSLSGKGLATSGDYRNYYEIDGQRLSHLIDPITGRPVAHKTASCTVLAANAMLADAWATAMLVLGREHGLEIADEQNLAVLFIERSEDTYSLAFESYFSAAFKAFAS